MSPTHNVKAPLLGGLFATTMTQDDIQDFEPCFEPCQPSTTTRNPPLENLSRTQSDIWSIGVSTWKDDVQSEKPTESHRTDEICTGSYTAIYQGHFPERWVSDLETIQQNQHTGWVNLFEEWNNNQNHRNLDPYFIDSIHLSSLYAWHP